MKRNYLCAFTLIIYGFCFPIVSSAKKIEVDDMTIEIMWKVKNEKLIAWGDVEGNRSCSQINLNIYFGNRKMDGIAYVDTCTARRHDPGDRSPFKGEDDIHTRKNKNEWFVKSAP